MPETGVFTAAAQPPSQQATRHARRVYVGGLPPTGNEQNIATFFSNALAAVGGTTAGPGMHKGSSCFGLHPDHPLQSSLCLSVSVCHKICSFPYLPSCMSSCAMTLQSNKFSKNRPLVVFIEMFIRLWLDSVQSSGDQCD